MKTQANKEPYSLKLAGRWEQWIEITIHDEMFSIQDVVNLIQSENWRVNPLEQMPIRNADYSGALKFSGKLVASYLITEVEGQFDEVESAYDPKHEEIELRLNAL